MVQYSEMWFGLVQTWDVLIKRNSHYACPASQLSGDFKALLLSWSRVGRDRNFPRYITQEVIQQLEKQKPPFCCSFLFLETVSGDSAAIAWSLCCQRRGGSMRGGMGTGQLREQKEISLELICSQSWSGEFWLINLFCDSVCVCIRSLLNTVIDLPLQGI